MDAMTRTESEIFIILLPNSIVVIIGLILSVCGNSLVMYIQWCKLKSPENFRIFIPYLALSDLLASVVCSCMSVYRNFHWTMWTNSALCKITWFCVTFLQSVSVMWLFIIALARYVKICRAFNNDISFRTKTICAIVLVSFVLIESVPVALFSGIISRPIIEDDDAIRNITTSAAPENVTAHAISFNRTILQCQLFVNHRNIVQSHNYVEIVCRTLLITVTILLYLRSGIEITKLSRKSKRYTSKKKRYAETTMDLALEQTIFELSESIRNISVSRANLSSNATDDIEGNVSKHKTASIKKRHKYRNINLMFFVITIIAIVSYTPRIIIIFFETLNINFWNELSEQQFLLFIFLYRLYLITYCTNPMVYSIMDKKFRKELKLILHYQRICGEFRRNRDNT